MPDRAPKEGHLGCVLNADGVTAPGSTCRAGVGAIVFGAGSDVCPDLVTTAGRLRVRLQSRVLMGGRDRGCTQKCAHKCTVSQNSTTRNIERQLVFGRVSRHSTIRYERSAKPPDVSPAVSEKRSNERRPEVARNYAKGGCAAVGSGFCSTHTIESSDEIPSLFTEHQVGSEIVNRQKGVAVAAVAVWLSSSVRTLR